MKSKEGSLSNFKRENKLNDPSLISMRVINEDYTCEYIVQKKDIMFLKRHGVVVFLPTKNRKLNDVFLDAIFDALFFKFKGFHLSIPTLLLKKITGLSLRLLEEMLSTRRKNGELQWYESIEKKLIIYVNPYEKEYL